MPLQLTSFFLPQECKVWSSVSEFVVNKVGNLLVDLINEVNCIFRKSKSRWLNKFVLVIQLLNLEARISNSLQNLYGCFCLTVCEKRWPNKWDESANTGGDNSFVLHIRRLWHVVILWNTFYSPAGKNPCKAAKM